MGWPALRHLKDQGFGYPELFDVLLNQPQNIPPHPGYYPLPLH